MEILLNNYKAKSDGTSLKQHNDDLFLIKNQIEKIYNLNSSMSKSLDKCILYHDIGKVVKSFQDSLDSHIKQNIRHEMLSASSKCLLEGEKLAVITHHKELKSLINWTEKEGYEEELKEMSNELDIEVEDIRKFIRKINIFDDATTKLDNMLLKGYLQYCDHVASAGIKDIEKGLEPLKSFNFKQYNSIQKQALETKKGEDILIIAPTGLGKTATSLFWSDIQQNEDKSKRIYYLLPYTASINSLYKDMVDKGISTSMMHSRVDYFLDKLNVENTKEMQNMFRKSVKQLNISTIYQIVKAMFSCRRFEMILAQLKDSIFIVDEIHCFDEEQLAMLITTLKFLKEKLNVSICIMSASIPTSMQKLISDELGIKKVIRSDSKDHIIRHRLHRVRKDMLNDLDKIKKDLDAGKQVLLCVNSVKTAQELYSKLESYNPKLIHGRFNARDREENEKGIKEAKLLIGTQAIEVSLDISYDVMYTEIAPFDSLQQRFGRVNRRGEKGICDIFIYDLSSTIYPDLVINRTDKVIQDIINNDDGILIEDKTQGYLDEVYPSFDMTPYRKVVANMEEVINTLKVATFNSSATDDMCQSDTIGVLPRILEQEYVELVKNKKYVEAKALLVNVRVYLVKGKEKEHGIYIVDFPYDKRGLVI